jgi:hypothetical protein
MSQDKDQKRKAEGRNFLLGMGHNMPGRYLDRRMTEGGISEGASVEMPEE